VRECHGHRGIDVLVAAGEHGQEVDATAARLVDGVGLDGVRGIEEAVTDAGGVGHEERLAERARARATAPVALRPGGGHRRGRLHEQRRVQQLDDVEVDGEADDVAHAERAELDRLAPVGAGDGVQQLRLGVGVRVVEPDAATDGGVVAPTGAGVEQHVIDAVAGHELLGLGAEGLGLRRERRRLGLGQQGADLAEHARVGLLCH
jgi:hypothetical protein